MPIWIDRLGHQVPATDRSSTIKWETATPHGFALGTLFWYALQAKSLEQAIACDSEWYEVVDQLPGGLQRSHHSLPER